MDIHAAERTATQAGLVTLPLGLALVAAPSRVGRHLGDGNHVTAMRVIGAFDLALVPGLVAGRQRSRWLQARAGLNLLIAAYFARLVTQERSALAGFTVAAMIGATVADGRAIAALRNQPQGRVS